MKPFKEFYYKLLSESPMNIGNADDYYNIETKTAMAIYRDILDNPSKFKKVYTFNTNPETYIYEERDDNDITSWLVPSNNIFVYAYVAYELQSDGGIITTSVFNDRKFPMVAFRMYNDYLLPKYKYIMSDKRHTDRGRSFWRKLIYYNLEKPNIGIYIWDVVTGVKIIDVSSSSDVDNFYGDTEDYERYRIKIENI